MNVKGLPLSIPSRLRLGLTLIIALTVESAPIIMFTNTTDVFAASAGNANRVDSSSRYGFTAIMPETSSSSSTPITIAPFTSSQDGSDFIAQAPLSGLWARQTNNIVGAQSYFDVVFVTSTTGTIKFIDITFPTGTVIGASINLAEREGIGAGSAIKTSDTVIRYTVTSAVSVPAGTKIRLEFFNIVNPTLPSTGYKVTVTTRTAGGTAIDGPTLSNSLNIKRISTEQIANGAITSTKPAESFMKKVRVLDNPIGHAVGWNPNGVDTDFDIVEEQVIVGGGEFGFADIIVNIQATVQPSICNVVGYFNGPNRFQIDCTEPPDEGSFLNYVVVNLPENIIG